MRKYLLYFALLIFGNSFSQNVPVAYDLSVSFYKDSSGIIQLVGSDQDGDDLTYVIYTVCSGTIQYTDDGVFQAPGSTSDHGRLIYKPYKTSEYNYFVNGTDTFEYLVRDEDGDSARATVTIKVYDEYLNPPTLIGEIDGEAEGDNFGHAISFSENGNIMAVGAPNNDADVVDSEKGSVRVYQYSGSGTDWQQIGNDIDGSNDGDEFGSSVSLSGDGKILAVGIPENDDAKANYNPGQVKVYTYDSETTTWNLTATISPNITETGINKKVSEQFGHDVRLSLDGKTLAVSDIWFNKDGGVDAGRVMVYKYDGTTWNAISGELELVGGGGDNASWGIALSARGDILAVGMHVNDETARDAGKVVVYEYNKSSNSWDTKGTLLGSSQYERFGAAVDLNGDGSTLIVGAPHFRENSTRTYLGKVKVFKWDGSAYSILGQEIIGSDKYDYFGAQLSIDSQGSTIAVMGPGHDADPGTSAAYFNKGRVRVYNYDETSTSWIQTPTSYDFDGEADGDQNTGSNKESRGHAAVLSADGSVLAYGANENDGNGSNSGHVRMYRLFETQIKPTVTSKMVDDFLLYEQQTTDEEITLDGSDPDSGPSDLVYIITQLETAKLFEGDTPITKSDLPYTLTGNKVKYNSNSDTIVNDEFYFIAQDGKASSCPGRIQLTVIPDNDAPVAIAQETLTTDEDVALSITLAGTDVDSPTSDFTYIIGTLPSNGTLKQGDTEINAAETSLTGTDITYTPNSNYSGNDSFTFKIKDKGVNSDGVTDVETSDAANISITVNNTDNDPPVAENKSISAGQDTETSAITLVASDPDSDNSTLIYSIASLPSNGILKDGGTEITGAADLTGALTYLPNDGYAGNDSFTFTAKDDQSAVSAAATVSISVSDTNDPPVATAKSITVNEDVESETIVLEATDPDATDTTFTFFIASLPSNGTLKDDGTIITGPTQISGALTYLSNTNYVGDDSFTFTAKDDESAESTAATVSITVNNTNDPPVADNQSVTTREDTTTNPVITLTATDPDTSDTSFTFTIKSLPTNGVLKDGDSEINTVDTDLSSATLTYTPNLNYNGSDSFTFTAKDDESAISSSATLSLTVSPWNDPPVAKSQDLTTDENVDLSITVSGTDIDGDTLTYVLYTLPSNGTLKQGDTSIQASDIPLTLSSNDFTYVPNTGYNGADSFKFKVRDLTPDSFATANSMELIKNAGTPITYETEYGKTYFLIQSTPTKMDWPDAKALTDSYYGARMYVVINADMEKAVYDALQSMNRLDGPFWMGLFQDRNADDYDEPDKGWYWVNGNKLGDGYVNWGEDEPNNSNDIEDYGQFNYGDKGIKWNDMEIGKGQSYALFEFTAEDSSADINITVSEFNDPPVATPQSVSTDEDVELDITLAGTDSEGSTLSYIVSELPTNGELKDGSETIKTDDLPKTLSSSSVKYIPNNYYNGSDSFKFRVKDTGNSDGSNKKESSDAVISITINSINNKPVPTPQSPLKTKEDTPIEITHTGTDPDGDNLDFIIMTLPSNGKLEDSGTEITSGDLPKKLSTEKVTYTPNDDFSGTDSYSFKANDGIVDSDSAALIELNIDNVNDPPKADNQSLKTNEDTELKITLTGSDPENDPLTYIVKTLPAYGKLIENGNVILESELPKLLPADSLTYVPDANYIGNDSFDFIINANYLNSFTKANGLKYISQNGVPVTYQKPKGKTYFLIQENTGVAGNNPIDWTDARDLTNSIEGATMYIILNAEMELLVWNGLKSMGLTGQSDLYYWIGLFQDRNADDYDEPDKGWYWVDGVKLGSAERRYTNWYQNEPNDAGGEDYAQFEFSSNGPDGIKWNDMSLGANAAKSWPVFEFAISGSSDSNTATISIEVQEVNDPPIADNIDLSMDEDGEVNVTMNATDPEGAIEMNYVIKSLPKNGKISENNVELNDSDIPKILSGKTVKYEPVQDFNGTDNFTYNAIDKDCPNTNTSKLEITGDFTASATGSNPMIIPPQNIKGNQSVNQKQVDIKFTVGQGDIFQSCEIKLDVKSFDDGLQFTIDGVNLLSFSQKHWDPSFGANTTEFSGSGRFVTNGNLWQPWLGDGNPKLEIATGKIKLMVDTKNGTREDALPFMDPSADSNWAKVNSFTYDCEAGFNLLIGNHNGGGGAGGIDADLTVEAYIVPCEESNVATVSVTVNGINDPPKADDQTVNTDEDLEVDITNVGSDIETDVLNLNYIVTSLPSNGILKDGSKTITASDIPYTLNNSNIATYVPNSDFYGEDKYNFKVNDGEDDSNIATVTIKIKEFILDLPNNYNIVTTETCTGSDFGIIDIEVVATSYKKTPSGPEIPITYNVVIEGKGNVGKITSPAKTLQIIDLPEGTHKLVFTVESELKYEHTENVIIDATDPPAAYPVEKFETCDDDKDNDDANGKVNFDTTTLIDKLLTNPGTGTKQDQNLFEFEFTYFDEATSASVTKSTLPNPFYSANQTISVKFKSKINGKCEASQNIDFQVNPLPSIERIEDNKSVCLNLPAITIGVKSSDSRTYTYTWTRDGTDFPPNINGTDSSILVGLGGEYVVTATTTDGTNCSKTMKITLSESETATFIKKDVEIKDLFAGPNNTITILTTTLGIGDYEYALDDQTGPYQDDPVFEKVRPGKHTVFVRDKNGCGTVSMDIWVIGFKKFFTPNGDGYTDFWNIIGITERYQANSKIYIFDRLGKLLKELDPLSPGWNGNFNGKPMPQTDYWFKVILEDGRTFEGHFSLVRGW